MIIRQVIEELRGDQTPQLRAQTAMAKAKQSWLDVNEVGGVLADVARYGSGEALGSCQALNELFYDFSMAQKLVGSMIGAITEATADQPLGQVPFRHNLTQDGASLMLASEGRAQLLLTERAPCRNSVTHAAFSAIERNDLVLAGQARCLIASDRGMGRAPICEAVELTAGSRFTNNETPLQKALLVESVEQSLVTLRLVRHPDSQSARPSRQVALATGEETQRAAATIAESRQELALSLIGAMGRSDAAPIAVTMSQEGPVNLRWQAIRQALAMDTATGFAELCAMADRTGDPLAPHAQKLRGQLLDAHPVLAKLAA